MKEDWTYKKLGEIAKIKSGKSIEANKILPYDDSLYPCYGGNGIRGYVEIFSNEGDIPIIGRVGALCGNVHLAHGKLYATEHALVVDITNPDIDANWLSSCLQSLNLRSIAKGVAQPVISAGEVSKICISIPSLKEQQQIVSELDLLSDVIKKQKTQIDELDKLAQSIFYDMFGDPVTNEKGWEVKKLKDVSSKITNGNTPKGGSDVYVGDGILFLRSQNVWRNKIVFDDVAYIDDATHEILHHSSLMHNDILITKTGRFNTENSSLGRAALYTGENNMANINGHVYLVRLKPGIDKKYVLYILLSESFRQLIRRVCVGGIDKRQLNKNHIEDFPIILPPLALQQEFAAKVEAIEQMKAKVRQSLKESEELFNSRMDYYFN